MGKRFEGKDEIVTGAEKGIGRAGAVAFKKEGGRVVSADMDRESGAGTRLCIEANGGRAIFVEGDIADETHVRR